jgi:hypothetical protein
MALRGLSSEERIMFNVIEKGGSLDSPLVQFSSFLKCAKWLVECADMFGANFEVWYVKRYKTKADEIELEAEYEVLP